MPLKDNVDWDKVDEQLPTSFDVDARAKRLEIFATFDPSGNNKLSLTEVTAGLSHIIDRDLLPKKVDFRPAIKCAFKLARGLEPSKKRHKRRGQADTSIDRTEFHALLICFREYLQLEVLFKAMDHDQDGKLNLHECKPGLALLAEWGISEKDVTNKFPDKWTAHLDYEDFADWCISKHFKGGMDLTLDNSDNEEVIAAEAAGDIRTKAGCETEPGAMGADLVLMQNKRKVMEALRDYDVDKSGTLDQDELGNVLRALDEDWTAKKLEALFSAIDKDKNGMIDSEEFMSWLFPDPE